jgi:hypothetical protein
MAKVLGKINFRLRSLRRSDSAVIMFSNQFGVITRSFDYPARSGLCRSMSTPGVGMLSGHGLGVVGKQARSGGPCIHSVRAQRPDFSGLIQDITSIGLCGLFCYLERLSVIEHIREKRD